MTRDDQTAIRLVKKRRQARLELEASEDITELIDQGFITVVRIRRDGGRVIRWVPGASEWFEATAGYCMARDADMVTEAHRKQVLATWRMIKDRVELSYAQQALMDEVMQFQ